MSFQSISEGLFLFFPVRNFVEKNSSNDKNKKNGRQFSPKIEYKIGNKSLGNALEHQSSIDLSNYEHYL